MILNTDPFPWPGVVTWVVAVLGPADRIEPGGIFKKGPGKDWIPEQWIYRRPFTFGRINVFFDTNRTFESWNRERY